MPGGRTILCWGFWAQSSGIRQIAECPDSPLGVAADLLRRTSQRPVPTAAARRNASVSSRQSVQQPGSVQRDCSVLSADQAVSTALPGCATVDVERGEKEARRAVAPAFTCIRRQETRRL